MKQVGQFLRAVILFALDMRPLSFYPTFAAPRTPYVIGHFRELSFFVPSFYNSTSQRDIVPMLVGNKDFSIVV